ncbi:hypothetical protein NDU88_001167 [Pleurodeles waltl]|uniref:Uncharacterized protein n=1 Tax=Pleurodeles waltl TaxID=8319 RepID=A0AAV7V904_PLEWA|nr:hypothetical protein NDU88_001167 [Pleurodeles waltl]
MALAQSFSQLPQLRLQQQAEWRLFPDATTALGPVGVRRQQAAEGEACLVPGLPGGNSAHSGGAAMVKPQAVKGGPTDVPIGESPRTKRRNRQHCPHIQPHSGSYKRYKKSLETQITAVTGKVGLLLEDQARLADRVKENEDTSETTLPQVKDLNQMVLALEKQMRVGNYP